MDDQEAFVQRGTQLLRYVTSYLDNIRDRALFPDVKAGFLREMIPAHAPQQGEKWEDVFKDIDNVLMPGMFHLQSPRRCCHWKICSTFPSQLGHILTNGLTCLCMEWELSPVGVELSMCMMDWMADMLKLPPVFTFNDPGNGGGMIQGNASEATLTCLLAARTLTLRKLREGQGQSHQGQGGVTRGQLLDRLVAYCSDQAHVSVEKAGMIAAVRMRPLPSDVKGSLRGDTLKAAILEDMAAGLVPFWVCATMGTTNSCAFDKLKELGPVCQEHDVWLHVDAAYAGSAFICPEFRPLLDGIEFATSFNFNAHKWLNVNYECSPLWVKNTEYLSNNFVVEATYLKTQSHDHQVPTFWQWQIAATSYPCRAIKLWFVLRLYGVHGLQSSIRHDVKVAHNFEALVRSDVRFEIIADVIMGLVCFRLKGPNSVTEALLRKIREDRQIQLSPADLKGTFFLRFAVCASHTLPDDVMFAWRVIKEAADDVTLHQTTCNL